jgi:hypothetical protein
MSPFENRSRSITHVSTSDEPIVRAAKLTTVASDRLGKFLERGLIGARVRRRPPSREGAWASTARSAGQAGAPGPIFTSSCRANSRETRVYQTRKLE